LDIKVLKIQNKNLSERLVQRQKLENELREKLDKINERKLSDDNKICIVDRYWTQLDEDLRIILERFDSSNLANEEQITSGSNTNNPKVNSKSKDINQIKSGAATPAAALRNFLAKLNDWDKVEIEENLKDRVKFTTQTVAKLITNFDK
jgi:E3 ubiquitin-protein ligase BRE1